MCTEDLQTYLEFAQAIAFEAGQIAKRFFGTKLDVRRKSDMTPVTQADVSVEKFLRDRIERKFPSHGIIGEELGSTLPAPDAPSRFEWVLDPIDGTKSFLHHIPLFTTLVSLLCDGAPVIGVIYNPILDEMTSAAVGCGASMNGNTIWVSTTPSLSEAWLQLTDPSDLLRRCPKAGKQLIETARYTRTWADAHGYALVARGDADVMIDPIMNLWDIACLKPIIEEAGGTFTTLDGKSELGTSCIASNGLFHNEVVAMFAKK